MTQPLGDRPLRIAFAGAGMISHFHLTGWKQTPKSYQTCFTQAIGEFVRGLRTGARFPTDRLDNLETLKLMESCYVAAGMR